MLQNKTNNGFRTFKNIELRLVSSGYNEYLKIQST